MAQWFRRRTDHAPRCNPSLRCDVTYNLRNFTAERGICFSLCDYKFFVYIMASKSRVLYTGTTNDLAVRVFQHKTERLDGFTKQYRVHRLVYFESLEIKHWIRQRRVDLIDSINPTWEDLAASWFSEELLAEPNARAVINYDRAKIQSAGEGKAPFKFKQPARGQPVRIKFRPSKTRTFGSDKDNRQG